MWIEKSSQVTKKIKTFNINYELIATVSDINLCTT